MDVTELWGNGEDGEGCGFNGVDVREIVDEVVREVERRVFSLGDGGRYGEKETAAALCDGGQKIRTLVLGELNIAQRRALASFSEIVESPENGPWDVVLVARMPVKSLAFTALLLSEDEVSEAVISGLLEGKRVYVLESGLDYRKYRETMPRTLYQKYQEYENVIGRFGCEIISEVMAMAGREGSASRGVSAIINDMGNVCDFGGRKLLRESDLLRTRREGYTTLLVGEHTIITPLAQDYITNHHLVIKKKYCN